MSANFISLILIDSFNVDNEGTCPTNIIIAYKNRLFSLEMYHPIDKNLLNMHEIYKKLNEITQEYSNKDYGIGIGALTADHRDNWADV